MADISGVVSDEGSPVEDATVVAVVQDTDTLFTTTTNAQGQYEFNGLPAGEYHVYLRGYEVRSKHSITVQ